MHKSIVFICVLATAISFSSAGIWDSLVNVDRQDNGDRKVGVHLPFIYWMDLNRNKNGPKLDLSVLGGLVKVNVDRNNNPGKRPVMVRFLGQKIYNSYPKDMTPSNYQQQPNNGASTLQGEESKNVVVVNSDSKPVAVVAQEPPVTEASPTYDVPPTQVN